MLPATYAQSVYSFAIVGQRVLLVDEKLSEQAKHSSTEPWWYLEVGDRRTLEAVVRWVRLHRAAWSEWGDMAKTAGRPALAAHMQRLLDEEPPAEVTGFVLQTSERDDELRFGEALATPAGLKYRLYHQHRFESAAHRQAFQDWLMENNPEANGSALLEVALNYGTDELGRKIDEIARDEFAAVLAAPRQARA